MARYPSDDAILVRTGRFLDVLDDQDNKLSPVKINLWAANLAGVSTAFAALLAWITAHWEMLSHIVDVGAIVGPYLGGSHVAHHYDKKLKEGS